MDNFTEDSATVQQFLNTNQYTLNGVLRYEKIFGRTFVSTGGKETTEKFLKTLNLKTGDNVLDVGSGLGGSAFLMDLQYGANVRCVDLCNNMVSLAMDRQKEIGSKNTKFVIEDITKAQYAENQFDLIYSRDVLIHIEDKSELYVNFMKWLKPGGEVFVTEYARGENQTEEFKEYVRQRDYKLVTVEEYRKILENCGLVDVKVTDLHEEFLQVLERELEEIKAVKEEFIQQFSVEDYQDLVDGWTMKIGRVKEGSQTWVSVYGRKPLSPEL